MSARNRIAIMQPYFLPYLGYWQLMNHVDTFVLYDDIQFTKRGWIHRNRYLNNESDQMFSLPLKKDSDYLDIVDRCLSEHWTMEKYKLIRRIEGAYKKAPKFDEGMTILENCLKFESINLFEFIFNSIKIIIKKLDISSKLVISSELGDTKDLKCQNRVLEICRTLSATEYINPTGGQALYQKRRFNLQGIGLKFHNIGNIKYDQMHKGFISNLSILDMFMFVGIDGVKEHLANFELKE